MDTRDTEQRFLDMAHATGAGHAGNLQDQTVALRMAPPVPWLVRAGGRGGQRGKASLPEDNTQARENRRGVARRGRKRVNE